MKNKNLYRFALSSLVALVPMTYSYADLTPAQLLSIHKTYVAQTAPEMEQATKSKNSFSYYFTSIGLMGMLSAVEAAAVIDPQQADAELQQVMHYIDNMIATATPVSDTDFNGVLQTRSVWPPISRNRPDELDSLQGSEPIARAAAVILKNPVFRAKYQAKATVYVDFVDQSIIQRWYVDLYNGVIPWLNEDTAHWDAWPLWNDKSWLLGDIVCSLYQATGKDQYKNMLDRIAKGFKAKLQPNKTGVTWDSGKIPIGSDTTNGQPSSSSDVGNQEGSWDTDHTNRAPMMIVFQYEAGLGGWTKDDVVLFANTLADIMWNQSTTNPAISNYINGSNKNYRTHFMPGENGFIFAGWSLLGSYTAKAQSVGIAMLQAIQNGVNNSSVSENKDAYYKLLGLSGHVLRSAVITGGAAVQPSVPAVPPSGGMLFNDDFTYKNGLLTNEYAFYNPNNSAAVTTPNWYVTSGSLFAKDDTGWTGIPDGNAPDATSSNANHSAVFRMKTRRTDFQNVKVSFSLMNHGLSTTPSTPAVAENGVHIFLRYQSEYNIYYGSINRRDNTVLIKKKVPGGPSNGGTYYTLSAAVPYSIPFEKWQDVSGTVMNNPDGSVTIQLFADGRLLVSAVDKGVGGPVIREPGAVGIRADNDNVQFKNFQVTSLDSSLVGTAGPAKTASIGAMRAFPIPWRKDKHEGMPVTFDNLAAATTIKIFTVSGQWVTTLPTTNSSVAWNLTNNSGDKVASGLYVYLATDNAGDKKKGLIEVIR